jgi:outer membrane protein OmpA-like peptidoglycan-associated protein
MSLLTDLCNTLDKRSLSGISEAVGESETSVSRGMQTAIGTVLGGMAAKSDDPGMLRKTLDMLPAGSGDVGWANLATAGADTSSPLMAAGRRILSALFGNSETAITHTLGTETGMPSGVTSSLLAMAAPMVMSYFTRRMRGDGLTMGGLSGLLQREIPALRAALPASIVNLLWPQREAIPTRPVVQQTMTAERSSGRWILPLILLALIPGLWWLVSHARRPVVMPTPSGTANRMIPEGIPTPRATLPAGVELYFDTASNRLQPDSRARLDEFASSIKGNRDVHVTINGYTDSMGNADSNMKLSQARADSVMNDLERLGIPSGELTAQGFGEDNPAADNSTADGRQKNRRVTVGLAGER